MSRQQILAMLILGLALTGGVSLAAKPRSAEVDFKAAEQKELVRGDLKGAIKDYERIAKGSDRALAAQAILRIAEIRSKLGDVEAQKVYERVVRDFTDQPDVVRVARERLGRIGSPANGIVCADCASTDTTMSADGRLVTFMDTRSRALTVRDLTTGAVRRLATRQAVGTLAGAIMSVISRDGKQLAYLDLQDSPRRLQVIGTEVGAAPRTVIERPAQPFAWSADNKAVLCLIPPDPRNPNPVFGWVTLADGSIREVKLSSALRNGVLREIAVSPDARFIAYALGEPNEETRYIHVMRADGSDDTRVDSTLGRNWAPQWAADGRHVLFLSNRSGKNGLWSISLTDGKAVGNASEIIADLGDGVITPLGTTPAGTYRYVFEQDGVERITIVAVDKGGRKIPGAEEHMLGTKPNWSPDGRYLAFTRRQPGVDRGIRRGAPHIVVIRDMVTGTERTFPTPLGELSLTDSWFSDSKGILVGLRGNGGAYRMNVETGELTRLFDGPVSDPGSPMWLSRDDKSLYAFRAGVVAKSIATGQETRVLGAGGGRLVPALSQDGTMWAISRRDFTAQRRFFGVTDAKGENLRELYSPPFDMLFEHVEWAPDNKTILFHQSRPEDKDKPMPRSTFFPNDVWPRQVMRLSIDGGAPEFTGIQVDGWMLGALAISPDGKRGAYSYVKPVSELRSLTIGSLP